MTSRLTSKRSSFLTSGGSFRSATKARMMEILTLMAILLLSTPESIAKPCLVNALRKGGQGPSSGVGREAVYLLAALYFLRQAF